MRTFFAVVCFGIGAAFAVGAGSMLLDHDSGAWFPAFFAGMFLLGAFLLLRRRYY